MELAEAIEKIKKFVQEDDNENIKDAINIVLMELEISQAMKEVAFAEGYKKGKEKGQQEGFYSGLAMNIRKDLQNNKGEM